MKKIISAVLLICLVLSTLMCWGCNETVTDGNDATVAADTTVPSDTVKEPASHEITLSEVTSVLEANGLSTNLDALWLDDGTSYHGGQQMRVCHTDRGTYCAFASDFGGKWSSGIQKYYVAKIDGDRQISILHYGEFESDSNEILVNIAQDINGDILVVTASPGHLGVCVIDSETDKAEEYNAWPEFTGDGNGYDTDGYSQSMFDFENRKIYAFFNGGEEGRYFLEWFVFDLETMSWDNGTETRPGYSHASYFANLEGVGRHCYLYPFPDGNGGAYVVGVRAIYAEDCNYIEKDMEPVEDWGNSRYLWDQMGIFHIPDLASTENIAYDAVHRAYVEGGKDGIWSQIINNYSGDVFIDSNGYIHIIYLYYLYDFLGTNPELDNNAHYRHAIYDGMECIFNEEITLPEKGVTSYRPMIRQSPDGKLHLIAAKKSGDGAGLYFYSAEDELGRNWKYEKNELFEDGLTVLGMSVSGVRDGSTQDGTLSCFFYGNGNTGYTFDISLEDYSIAPVVNILEGYDLYVDWRYDERVPSSEQAAHMITTDNSIYAAFIYNYAFGYYEYFHIVKIDNDGKVTVLISDYFKSLQDKYITMTEGNDGMIYVGLPDGRNVYVIDTATDEVTLRELTPILTKDLYTRQMSIIKDLKSGEEYCVSVLQDGAFNVSTNLIDAEKNRVSIKNAVKYENTDDLAGMYDEVYTLSDGKGGVYLVGTRKITQEELGGSLKYNGHISYVNDSVVLVHIPSLSESTEVKYTEVHHPHEDEGIEGIWSAAAVKDVYLGNDGKLRIVYSDYHFDYDDKDRRENPELVKNTLKYYLAVYDGAELVSKEEIKADGLTEDSSVKITETADGTLYLLTCNLVDADLVNRGYREADGVVTLVIYSNTDGEWTPCLSRELGDFLAEGLFVGGPTEDNAINCLIYATNNDLYYMNIAFTENN
ncbi:MAG: hypothetical protein IKT70_02615 [Clostridia bacterium]|nr:hypothetical protein [Clostridia bacterium]